MLVETLAHLLSDFAMKIYRTSFYERLRSRIFLPKSLCAAVKLVFCYPYCLEYFWSRKL